MQLLKGKNGRTADTPQKNGRAELLNGLAADDTLPPGPRFETFLYADRVLGLNLPGDIGR